MLLCVSKQAPGAGPKAEVKNPFKGCTDPAMAWYGSLPEDQQQKVKIGGGYVDRSIVLVRLGLHEC